MAYPKGDPRAALNAGKDGSTDHQGAFFGLEHAMFREHKPYRETKAARSWLVRATNFIIEYTDFDGEDEFARVGQPDEYMVVLHDATLSGSIEFKGERTPLPGQTLAICPPGDTVLRVSGKGQLLRFFSSRAKDLADLSVNAAHYKQLDPLVAPIVDWPDPVGGFKVRTYDITHRPAKFGPIYRSTNMMVNLAPGHFGPRDTTKLSPHAHADFEQCSLSLSGDYVHHIRWPWGSDMSNWREDEHLAIGSPGVTMIPARALHTTQHTGTGMNQLYDVFAPPRWDFSLQDGWVLNADEYPMPEQS